MTAGDDEGWEGIKADFTVTEDDGTPTGGVFLRSAEGQRIIGNICDAGAEELRSLAESEPFLIRLHEASGSIRCEMCGTWVLAIPESPAEGERRWTRAIWENGVFRKHTLRRCEWWRSQGRSGGD